MALRRRPTRSGLLVKDTPFMQTARMRFKQACDADKGQDTREREDLRFYNDDQWPEDIRRLRAGQPAGDGMPLVPARPCLTINKVKAPVLRVLNQERQSDIGIEIIPADDFEALVGPIDDTEIELREGLTRRIQRTSEAGDARTWAFQRATIAGRGVYRVLTRYMPGKTFNQEVVVSRIFNQGAVRLDPAHEQPDGSDADWAFVGAWISWEKYKATWPTKAVNGENVRNPLAHNDDEDHFQTLAETYKDWFKVSTAPDGETQRMVHISEYIYCTYVSKTAYEMPDGTVLWEDEATDAQKASAIDSRTVPEREFTCCTIDGIQLLESTPWPIPYTGIVKVLGEEIQPYDDERRAVGMVRSARGSQEGFNAMASKMVEVVAYAPIPPIMLAAGQDEGFEAEYVAAMTRTLPVLHYNQKDIEGQPAQIPFAPPRNAPIEPVAFALTTFSNAIQDTTNTHDSALGKTEQNVKSSRHAERLIAESELGTANSLDNLVRSMRYEGLLINALLYSTYGRKPGRLAHMLLGDGETRPVLIGQPFTLDPKSKRPVKAEAGAEGAQQFTLTEHARFNVAIKVTKNYDTRRQQEASTVGELISAEPQLMTWFGDLFFKNQDGPGHKEMAERAKVMLAPPIQQLLESKKTGQPPLPPQVQQQMAQITQQNQQFTQAVNELSRKVQTDEVKQANENARAEHEQAVKLQIEQINAQKDVEIERTKAALAIVLLKMTNAQKNLDREDTQAHELGMAGAEASHEAEMAAAQAELQAQMLQSEAVVDDMASDKALETGAMGHQQALEQQDAAAAAQPEGAA